MNWGEVDVPHLKIKAETGAKNELQQLIFSMYNLKLRRNGGETTVTAENRHPPLAELDIMESYMFLEIS